METKKTLTIGIPAHNEAATILRVLSQIMSQQSEHYILQNVIVACDGCTDNTADLVNEFAKSHPVVRVINDGMRRGKAGRLNDFYANNTSDVFVSFDGDVELGSDVVLDQLVLCFDSPKVGLVGGYDLPKRGRTFVERVIVAGIDLWYFTREALNNGDSVHNHHGCVSALSKKFCEKVQFDTTMVSDDEYLYLRAIELGFTFTFCKTAPVYYRAPTTINDYLRQSARFMGFKQSLDEHFGSWIDAHYVVPRKNKVAGLIKGLWQDPVHMPFAILLQLYTRIVANKYLEKNITGGMWTSVRSTKQ